MSQGGLTPKQTRIVEKDVETLFAPRAFLSSPTIETIKSLGLFHPAVRFKTNTLFLSGQGVAALHRLTGLICDLPMLAGLVSRSEIRNQVMESYNKWFDQLLQPTGREFIEAVTDALLATVKDHEFLIRIEGIDLVDQDALDLGSVRISAAIRRFWTRCSSGGPLMPTRSMPCSKIVSGWLARAEEAPIFH